MKNKKNGLIILSTIFVVFTLIGCGVSKDEHEKTVAELAKTKAELEKANLKIAEMEKSVLNIPKINTADIQGQLQAAEKKARELSATVKSLTLENNALTDQMSKLKGTISDLEKKIQAFQQPSKDLPLDMFKNR